MYGLKYTRKRVNSIVVKEDEANERFFIHVNKDILLSIKNSDNFLVLLKSALKEDESCEIIMNHHAELVTRKAKVIFYNNGEFIEINRV